MMRENLGEKLREIILKFFMMFNPSLIIPGFEISSRGTPRE
jgi:hypothetical protein